MASCLIFNAGDFTELIEPIQETDLVLAADGGLKHVQSLGLSPHAVLGDFDSLGFTPEGAEVLAKFELPGTEKRLIRTAFYSGGKYYFGKANRSLIDTPCLGWTPIPED